MKALRVKELTGFDGLAVEEVASPACGPGQVRIKVSACGINFADTLIIKGEYQEKPDLPFTPGGEISGEIIEAGDGVKHLKPGQNVVALSGTGGLAEETVCDAKTVVPIPPQADPIETAAFLIAYGTSHVALDHRANLKQGETLLVHGAGGGVGLTAVEIGKLMGATVIATAGSQAKLDAAKAKGADHLINYSSEDIRDQVKAFTGGKGADVIYDPVGGSAFDASLRCINFEGRLVTIGYASGDIPKVPANILLVKNIAVLGLYWGSYAWKRPDVLMKSMQTLMGWYLKGEIKPHVSEVFPLDRAADAIRQLAERRSTGKVVVAVDPGLVKP